MTSDINNTMIPEPQLPSPVTTPTRGLATDNNNICRLNIAMVVIGANVAIEVQDEFTTVDCEVYEDSPWMSLELALPRHQEVMTKKNLISKFTKGKKEGKDHRKESSSSSIQAAHELEKEEEEEERERGKRELTSHTALIRGFWPAVDTTSFKLKLVKSSYLDPDDNASICYGGGGSSISSDCNIDQGSPLTPLEPQRFCQAVLGVREEESAGIAVYGDIVLGPRIPYDEANAKRPEYEHETLAVMAMVRGLFGALSRLTLRERKRLAEQTYEGSSNVLAVKKVKTEGGDWSQAILID